MTPMIVEHPLLQHKLSILRNKQTGTKEFRDLVGEIATLLCYEATRDLPMTTRTIETPICPFEAIRARAVRAAEPMAKPLPVAAVVLPRESRASVRWRTSGARPAISAMPPALSATGP